MLDETSEEIINLVNLRKKLCSQCSKQALDMRVKQERVGTVHCLVPDSNLILRIEQYVAGS